MQRSPSLFRTIPTAKTSPWSISCATEAVSRKFSSTVQANIGAFFSERKEIFPFPQGIDRADTILLYLDYPFDKLDHTPFEAPYAIITPLQFIHAVKEFLNKDAFGIVYFHKGWLIARRNAASIVTPKTVHNRLDQIANK